MALLNMAIVYIYPIVLWTVYKRKASARAIPLIAGIVAYFCISFLRAGVRSVVFTDELKKNAWLFYVVSALISGVLEESGRYTVFRWCIPDHDRWSDCIAYGIGHGAVEMLLNHSVTENTLFDDILECYNFTLAVAFSAALSVLVFAAVHYAGSNILFFSAIGLHTVSDIIPGLYFRGVIGVGQLMLIDLLFTAGLCYLARIVYRRYSYSSG